MRRDKVRGEEMNRNGGDMFIYMALYIGSDVGAFVSVYIGWLELIFFVLSTGFYFSADVGRSRGAKRIR